MLYATRCGLNQLFSVLSRAYNAFMKKFIAQNGQEVAKFVTPSGVTGYVDTSIPMEALVGLRDKLATKIANREAAERRQTSAKTVK